MRWKDKFSPLNLVFLRHKLFDIADKYIDRLRKLMLWWLKTSSLSFSNTLRVDRVLIVENNVSLM